MHSKVLLINPPVYSWGKMEKIRQTSPPLGLLSLAAYLEKECFPVEVLDLALEPAKIDLSPLKDSSVKIVGITATTNTITSALEVARKVRSRHKDIFIVFGGPHPSILPEDVLQNEHVDFVVIGEGEFVFLSLCRALIEGRKWQDIESIAYRENGSVKINQRRGYIDELDSLPFPARHLVPFNKYRATPINYKRWPSTPVITSRGCPFECTFCSNPVHGKALRLRAAANVVEELTLLKEDYRIRDVIFWDDTFTLDKGRVKEICDLLIRKNLKLTWSCATRVDAINLELLQKMKDSGCWQISFGVESGVERLRKKVKKNITNEQIVRAFRYCRDLGIETRAFFILGLPTETEAESKVTIEFAKKLNPDFAQFTLAVPYPGSMFFKEAVLEGWRPPEWEKFQTYPQGKPVYIPKGRRADSLIKVQSRAFKQFYFRPRYLLTRLSRVSSFSDFVKNVKTAFNLLRF